MQRIYLVSIIILLIGINDESNGFRLPNIKIPPQNSKAVPMHVYLMTLNGTEHELPQAHYIKSAKPESEMFIIGFGAITVLGMLLVLWKGLQKKKKNNYRPIYA